ncbi:MAG: DUF1552 domain-containing protein [Opitutae bacterium]|nr:DUF1552 domain-containing protein [Opitutae bacterium]MBT5379767.1 DUF1552 domain-containing protein [Opitutae bacterium]MBT5691026.1 DUF1552 domain-containing protein [Opitutae bacterium]MBT6462570.1 DUF1552 domain-containing protein [Opitutae bacterium]MBT7853575.1 DUF1552 domain-containing protein [Opitutae bacterium]
MKIHNRRRFLRDLGLSGAALPFLAGLPGLQGKESTSTKQRLVVMFSPNGTLPNQYWPDPNENGLALKPIMKPLEPFKERLLTLKGVHNRVRGDGDNHMRGISCLLTAKELHRGNIQGGSHTPAGWASGISIDQEISKHLQSQEATRTRFGSLEFGVAVPNRADPWTRMSYAGSNKPLAPIDDPHRMLQKMYGKLKDRDSLVSILDDVSEDLKRVAGKLGKEDRSLLEEHLNLVRQVEQDLQRTEKSSDNRHPEPELDPEIELVNDNTPLISRMQIDLLVNGFANDMMRVASLQFMRSVGQARMRWLGIEDGHHSLSHKPDKEAKAQEKLLKINQWFAGELAYLCKRLLETPEPGGDGNMLDHTTIVWLNELGKGNSHTLDNIPFTLIGGGLGFKMGRAIQLPNLPHNRLLLSIAHGFGHHLESFGNNSLSHGGPLDLG